MKELKKESVLCIYTHDAEKLELLNVNNELEPERLLKKLTDNNHLFMFQSRCQIEENTNVIQIIPYVFIENEKGELLLYKRKGSEERLHDLYSIGIGGHISLLDTSTLKDGSIDIKNTIGFGLGRELIEELHFNNVESWGKTPYDCFNLTLEGTLYKTNTMVDLVHLGLVYKLDIDSSNIDLNNSEIKPVWASRKEIKELYPQLENWSKELYNTFLF